jgi:putative FmdB family regulatory protein
MPIYEYQCAACGRVEEKWQKVSEDPLTTCAACGGSLSKLISSCSFHLKGSGWYVTDYSGNRSGATPSPAGEGAKASEGSESAPKATEAKAAEKIETAAPAKKFK